jgi:hypothetical protein
MKWKGYCLGTLLYELDGHRFGRWLVIRRAECLVRKNGQKISRWYCQCDCGNEVIVLQNSLVNGSSTQCTRRSKHKDRIEGKGRDFDRVSFFPGRSLGEKNPELSKQWHPTKNGALLPHHVPHRSNKKVWWSCAKGHEYEARINSRLISGCPFCANRKIDFRNSLAALNPALASEWHPTKNGYLTPSDVPPGGARKVWWQCPKYTEHQWQRSINARDNRLGYGNGCPWCGGKRVDATNSFSSKFPDLAKQWHSTKNNGLLPSQVTFCSGKKVWWTCAREQRNHEPYLQRISDRANGRGCPKCKNQTSIFELRLLAELEVIFSSAFHRYKACGDECDIYLPDLKLAIEIDGGYYHKDRVSKDLEKNERLHNLGLACLRVRGYGLEELGPNDIKITKGQEIKPNLRTIHAVVSAMKAFTIDEEILGKIDHYLKSTEFINQTRFNKLVLDISKPAQGRALSKISPQLATEWHPTKNQPLTPDDVSYGSALKVWWLCDSGHEWEAAIDNRIKGSKCRYCSGWCASRENNLAVVNPKLAEEWHTTKNGKVTSKDVTPNSNKLFWWQCSQNPGHQWPARVNDRNRKGKGTNCPHCSTKRKGDNTGISSKRAAGMSSPLSLELLDREARF